MRNLFVFGALGTALLLAGCGKSGLDRNRPDEFAVARQAPLVIPPDFSLVPPQPGAPRPQDTGAANQGLEALFGGAAARSASETVALREAGSTTATPGVRSEAGDPQTNVIDKGSTTRDIVAAPQGDGQDARAVTGTPTPPKQ
ncbi:DUF3035 domain-containing protein [Sphingomonas sp. 37zxx]|uniref:DUF3035 domain-containing protein n=1 Tax=Sphingomonas sp. 37zxx TaxID=1550073 RepID=UPI00053BE3C5|nr:DUF3035 domain-containing protein [Sphingomonas sp. 37zxx]